MAKDLDYLEDTDRLVNLKTPDEENRLRLLPRTVADAVIETEEKQFISDKLKSYFAGKQDNLGYIPVNRAGDIMSGALLVSKGLAFTQDNQIVSKKYVDDRFKNILGASPETLDTIYELANAIGNDPNFAVTITNMVANKVNSSEVTNGNEANKIPRLDADGELSINVKGNAKTASSLKRPFVLSLTGDISSYTIIDGNKNVSLNVSLPIASVVSSGIITPEDYIKLNNLASEVENKIGARIIEITSVSFIQNTDTNLYELSIDVPAEIQGRIGNVQTLQLNNGYYEDILTDISVSMDSIKIESIIPFTGRLVYSILL